MSKKAVIIYAVFAALFVLLGFLAHQFIPFPGDAAAGQWLSGIGSGLFNWLMSAVSWLGKTVPSIVTVSVVVVLLFLFHRRLESLFVLLLVLSGEGVTSLFKFLVDRPRPGGDLLAGGTSFPSGHVVYSVVFFGFLAYLAPRLIKWPRVARTVQVILILLILLGGVSRVYLERHWPSDVLGGLLLGGLLLVPAITLFRARLKKREASA
ncbi:MAG: phosphatase PAP2 family protein [Dehalococcoidales bacterium]